MEEIDLCWRIKNRGYKVMYNANSEVFHVGGGTLPNNNPRKLYYNFRNNLFMLYKNLPSNTLFHILLFRMLLDLASSALYMVSFQFKFGLAVLSAHKAFLLSIGNLRKKRKTLVNQLSTKPDTRNIYKKSIVIDFFIRKKKQFNQLNIS